MEESQAIKIFWCETFLTLKISRFTVAAGAKPDTKPATGTLLAHSPVTDNAKRDSDAFANLKLRSEDEDDFCPRQNCIKP